MKMVLARLSILTLKVHITVFVMIVALVETKYGCMRIGFIQNYGIFDDGRKTTKGLHQTILQGG